MFALILKLLSRHSSGQIQVMRNPSGYFLKHTIQQYNHHDHLNMALSMLNFVKPSIASHGHQITQRVPIPSWLSLGGTHSITLVTHPLQYCNHFKFSNMLNQPNHKMYPIKLCLVNMAIMFTKIVLDKDGIKRV